MKASWFPGEGTPERELKKEETRDMKRDERGKSKQNDRVTFQVVENASAAHGREAILGMDDVSGVGVNKKKQEFIIILTQNS